jgi:hypothetical protein
VRRPIAPVALESREPPNLSNLANRNLANPANLSNLANRNLANPANLSNLANPNLANPANLREPRESASLRTA